MQRQTVRLLNVILEPEKYTRNETSCWQVRPLHTITANGSMLSNTAGADRTYCIFRNMAASVAFYTLIVFVPDVGQTTSVIWVSRADSLIKCVKDNLKRRMKGVPRGVGNRMSWKPDSANYYLWPTQTCKSIVSLVFIVRYPPRGGIVVQLVQELEVYDTGDQAVVLQNRHRRYTLAVYYFFVLVVCITSPYHPPLLRSICRTILVR